MKPAILTAVLLLLLIALQPILQVGADVESLFRPDLIHRLPPTAAEWISREGMEFAAHAAACGMSWAAAEYAFTGDTLHAEAVGPDRIRIDSITADGRRKRWGWIQCHAQPDPSYRLISIQCSPEGGTYRSTSFFRIYPSHDDFGRTQIEPEEHNIP